MNCGSVPQPPGTAPAPYAGFSPAPPPRRSSSKRIVWTIVSVVVAVLVLVILFVGAILSAVFSSIKSSAPYQHAVQVATHDPRVQTALGPPVKPGVWFTGNIQVHNDAGDADFAIPVAGSAHKGMLYVVAKKSEGEWTYQKLALRVEDSGRRIDLLRPVGGVLPEEK